MPVRNKSRFALAESACCSGTNKPRTWFLTFSVSRVTVQPSASGFQIGTGVETRTSRKFGPLASKINPKEDVNETRDCTDDAFDDFPGHGLCGLSTGSAFG